MKNLALIKVIVIFTKQCYGERGGNKWGFISFVFFFIL